MKWERCSWISITWTCGSGSSRLQRYLYRDQRSEWENIHRAESMDLCVRSWELSKSRCFRLQWMDYLVIYRDRLDIDRWLKERMERIKRETKRNADFSRLGQNRIMGQILFWAWFSGNNDFILIWMILIWNRKKSRVGQYLQNVKYAQHFNFLRFTYIFLRKKV